MDFEIPWASCIQREKWSLVSCFSFGMVVFFAYQIYCARYLSASAFCFALFHNSIIHCERYSCSVWSDSLMLHFRLVSFLSIAMCPMGTNIIFHSQCKCWIVCDFCDKVLLYVRNELTNFHSSIPKNRWVKRQRHQYNLMTEKKTSTLTGERIRLLEKIGFVWNCLDTAWQQLYKELCIFKMRTGHW